MYIESGGDLFSFCPGKATWDPEAVSLFQLLLVSAETGNMYEAGGLADQPYWWIELSSWFLRRYDDAKFASRVKAVLGEPSHGGGNRGGH